MPILRRGYKRREDKHGAQAVTGGFELHYEDVVGRNRLALVALFASALLLVAAFIPKAIDQSIADTDRISAEAEAGQVINPELVKIIKGDLTASEDSYIEFRSPAGQ